MIKITMVNAKVQKRGKLKNNKIKKKNITKSRNQVFVILHLLFQLPFSRKNIIRQTEPAN